MESDFGELMNISLLFLANSLEPFIWEHVRQTSIRETAANLQLREVR